MVDWSSRLVKICFALLFMLTVLIFAYVKYQDLSSGRMVVMIAVVFGGYMAINIGANDVANNVGPAVGSGAITLFGALVIAAICEAAGAIIAGGDVTSTIKNGIINPDLLSKDSFLALMMAALLGGAIWLNLATMIGAPVSTTHSIVGGVLGAGIAAGGWQVAEWSKLTQIVASWVISPVMGGVVAALLLLFIKRLVIYRENVLNAARFWIPVLLSFMVWAFGTYIILKGLKKIIHLSFIQASLFSAVIAVISYFILKPIIRAQVNRLAQKNNTYGRRLSRKKVSSLFTLPLIAAAALLSFAHGSNDVANAIGPLAAIVSIIGGSSEIGGQAYIPLWVMLVGALGLSVGLVLFGPKLIKTVGNEITELNKTRAFCVAMAAALTVIVASQLGIPVSSTHIAVGGIFGVGFLREYLVKDFEEQVVEISLEHDINDQSQQEYKEFKKFIRRLRDASIEGRTQMLNKMKKQAKKAKETPLTKKEIKTLAKANKRQLVQRKILLTIVAAWVITVPASAILSAGLFFIIRLF